ncbi:MAG TPA: pantoate--beta-alanine ligase [Caulobacteraceae bacterium]|nr:pantoate--beta-alanine ligase [Caulobacteraceae bacterium]
MTAVAILPLARSPSELRREVRAWKKDGQRVALVPTMGALHEGHLSLVRLARENADRVVASLFVNPTQFSAGEDLERYPRQEAKDQTLLSEAGCDLLFAPAADAVYPRGFATAITVSGVSDDLEGRFRPQMFRGVATVVAKLLIAAEPDVAVFGEKDYQQLLVIRRLVRDLDLPVEIVAGPTVREDDGLAMSSRNAYLDPTQRMIAGRLNLALADAARRAKKGDPVAEIEADTTAELLEAGFDKVDYVAIRNADDLAPFVGTVDAEARVLAAARISGARLIDNLPVGA